MAKEITFSNSDPQYVFDRNCLSFRAQADGEPVECLISTELLFSRFRSGGFTEEAMRNAYQEHRAEILALARAHIENGWIDDDRRVFLSTRITRMDVSFAAGIDEFPNGRAMIDAAHRILVGIIGPNAEAVSVEWSVNTDPPGHPCVNVRIVDPTTKHSIAGSFGPKESADPTVLSVYLARLWGSVLRERSRKLSIRAG